LIFYRAESAAKDLFKMLMNRILNEVYGKGAGMPASVNFGLFSPILENRWKILAR
jgi:hypothetical protein